MHEIPKETPTYLILVFPQAVPARITLFYQLYHTQIFTVTRSHIQVSSPTWKRGVKRGTTVTSMVAKRRSSVPTAPSSPKQYLCVTGGSTSDATSARLYMQLTADCTGRLGRTLHDHTGSSPKNFYKTYSYECVYSKRLIALENTFMQVKTHEVNSEETAIPLIRLQKVIKTHALKDQH